MMIQMILKMLGKAGAELLNIDGWDEIASLSITSCLLGFYFIYFAISTESQQLISAKPGVTLCIGRSELYEGRLVAGSFSFQQLFPFRSVAACTIHTGNEYRRNGLLMLGTWRLTHHHPCRSS